MCLFGPGSSTPGTKGRKTGSIEPKQYVYAKISLLESCRGTLVNEGTGRIRLIIDPTVTEQSGMEIYLIPSLSSTESILQQVWRNLLHFGGTLSLKYS